MDQIGKYEIVEKIGQGGMGAVYRGRDSIIGRDVAIKVIHESALDTPDARERFYREARSAGRLSHENITTVYDVGEDDGKPFIVMEYLEGEDLRATLRSDSNIEPEDKLDIAIQICQGLHYAHKQNVIHRDIKPDNIRRLPDGRIKILDFGIARIQGDNQIETLTVTGMSVGTPRYMSPEQIRGEKLDARSDIFSFGVLFYEILSGTAPFTGDQVTTLIYKILNAEPEPVEFDPKSISDELHPILFKCLEKDREKRYNDLTEVLRDLQVVIRKASAKKASAKTKVLDSTISTFLAKEDITKTAQSFDVDETMTNPREGMRKRLGMIVGAVALVAILVWAGLWVLGSRTEGTDDVGILERQEVTSAGDSKTNGEVPTGSSSDETDSTPDESQEDSEMQSTNPAVAQEELIADSGREPATAAISNDRVTQAGRDAESGDLVKPIVEAKKEEIPEEISGNPVSNEVPPPNGDNVSEDQEDGNDNAGSEAPTEAVVSLASMLEVKGAISAEMAQHPTYLKALEVENQGNQAYTNGSFQEASILYEQAGSDFEAVRTVRRNLDARVLQLTVLLDAGFGDQNLDRLRDVHDFYSDDYYANLFAAAESVSASTASSDLSVSVSGAMITVRTSFVYHNNKNEEIAFERSERWSFTELNGRWNLTDVRSL